MRYFGITGTSLGYVISKFIGAKLANTADRQFVIVTPDLTSAESLTDELRLFLGNTNSEKRGVEIFLYSAWDVLPFEGLSPSTEVSAERLETLSALQATIDNKKTAVVVTPVAALMQKVAPRNILLPLVKKYSVGQDLDRGQFIASLESLGYVRSSIVEEVGEMAVRGAVVDFFPCSTGSPVRFELYADVLESIRVFDTESQRSTTSLSSLTLTPIREYLLPAILNDSDEVAKQKLLLSISERARKRTESLELPPRVFREIEEIFSASQTIPGIEHLSSLVQNESESFFDYLSDSAELIICDEVSCTRATDDFSETVAEGAERAKEEQRLFPDVKSSYLTANQAIFELKQRANCYFDEINIIDSLEEPEQDPQSQTQSNFEVYSNRELTITLTAAKQQQLPFKPLADYLNKYLKSNFAVAILVSNSSRLNRVKELLASYDLMAVDLKESYQSWFEAVRAESNYRGQICLLQANLSSGLRDDKNQILLISDNEILPSVRTRRTLRKTSSLRKLLGSATQLKEKDFIVHIDHGVGIYHGLKAITVEGKTSDFLELEYAEGAKLFLPVENIAKIHKYAGAEGKNPALDKLGAKTWAKTKKKVKESIAELAGELVNLYAAREIASGFNYGEVDADDLSFADSFPFELTADQAKAIEDVFSDLAKSKPMDRLVCGDVGYGKTEVALRAAFKAASCGKQVAILVPTTVLAEQHYVTFKERFLSFPFRVGTVSRFYPNAENKKTLSLLANGELDIIIGTHRLLSKDVFFKRLGLVIVDEEHRFGVTHKERLKKLRNDVDVLTLTATPIPRTLHMSLIGIRDLSVIETPPVDRQVIRTYLANFDERSQGLVRDAILRELNRDGQIFYIHNRVQTIAAVAEELRELVPEARIEYAHGQMKERELENVMHRFVNKEIDILVSTTIIESGLDIPNANTIIIRNAEKFGLAELYQLRGRVGRSSRRAYAYLLVGNQKFLSSDARKRLKVLQSLDDLGVGFKLALQDMEIRGAGNLLGRDQSGQINLVGFELYTRILKEAIEERKERSSFTNLMEQSLVEPEIKIGFSAHIPEFYIPDVAERILLYQRLVGIESEQETQNILEEMEDRFGSIPKEVITVVQLMLLRSQLRKAQVVSLNMNNQTIRIEFGAGVKIDIKKVSDFVSNSKGEVRLLPPRGLVFKLDESLSSPKAISSYISKRLYAIGICP
jgi:transcription-repair coupling factor (superfamily II helicase)